MKKLYSSLSILAFVALGSNAMAQTTITVAALPQIGYVYNMASDTLAVDLPSFTVSAGSAVAQTWNYTSEFANIYADPTAFVAPSGGAGSSNFPSATMAIQQPNLTDWVYLIGNSGGLFVDGAYVSVQGTMTAINFNPNQILFPAPFTYGNNVQNDFAASFPLGTATVNHRVKRTITADAFGSLTTPTATYPNTLRVKAYEITSDSVFLFGGFLQGAWDTTTSYTWMQNTQDAQLMSIDMDAAGAVTKAQYLQSFSSGVAFISQPAASFGLFPNPATDMTYLTYENKVTGMVNLQLFDLDGRQIAVLVDENQVIGKQKIAINVEALHLPKGLYFLQLNSNNSLQTIKLNIN